MSQITSNKLHDDVFVFKILNDLNLTEKLKTVEVEEVFTSLNDFCSDELKVSTLFYACT